MMCVFFVIIMGLVACVAKKIKVISMLHAELHHLNKVIRDLDHQAKIIIKSDMEAKLYQQEIEEELNKLTLIKNLIVSSLHILDREKLFLQINERVINQ